MHASTNHRHALPMGYHLQEYRIESILGHGGFGLTYLAHDTQLDAQVAIKEYLPNELAVREGTRATVQPKSQADAKDFAWGLDRFLKEARIVAQFNHPNIVRVRRFFPAHNTAYIVMDYEQGQSLANVLTAGETATEAELMHLLPPLLAGLKTVHEAGYLHRDIKPGNIYLRDKDNSPVLIDFGAARYAVMRSRNVTTMVTPGYSPFELYQRKSLQGAWTDIYALGAVLYRTIGGAIPVEATARIEASVHNQADPLIPAVQVGRGLYSKRLLQGIDWALQTQPAARPQNVTAWAKAILPSRDFQKTKHAVSGMERSGFPETFRAVSGMERSGFPETFRAVSGMERSGFPETFRAVSGMERSGFPETTGYGIVGLAVVVVVIGLSVGYTQWQAWREQPATEPAIAEPQLAPRERGAELAWLQQERERLEQQRREREAEAALKAGIAAFESADYATTLAKLQPLAEQGNAQAQWYLGQLYRHGLGVTQNAQQAVYWYRKSAAQAFAEGQYELGAMYFYGEGVAQDDSQALDWFRQAAAQDNASGQNALGVMYRHGKGVEQNYNKALHLFRQAAEQGNAKAQYNLGELYEQGTGVPQDHQQASDWYRQAAEGFRTIANQGFTWAQNNLGEMYHAGQGVAQDESQAGYWYHKAAEQGDADAQFNVGIRYLNGTGVSENAQQAVRWFRKAAAQEHAAAQYVLGMMYENGTELAQDDAQAFYWYQKAAEQGHAPAQSNLGVMYKNGQGVESDDAQAVHWFRQAAEQGDAPAQSNLGVMYENGLGVEQDDSQAVHWFRQAAEQGHAPAQSNLGIMYYYGKGIEPDYARAVYWYRQAAEQDYAWGQYHLGYMYEYGKGVPTDEHKSNHWYRKAAAQNLTEAKNKAKYYLTVNATPSDSRIRIMNINPTYAPRIALKPDIYEIEVAQTGYQSKTFWIEITDSDLTIDVTLNR